MRLAALDLTVRVTIRNKLSNESVLKYALFFSLERPQCIPVAGNCDSRGESHGCLKVPTTGSPQSLLSHTLYTPPWFEARAQRFCDFLYSADREHWGLSREKNKAYFRTDSLLSLFLIVTLTVKSKAANLI